MEELQTALTSLLVTVLTGGIGIVTVYISMYLKKIMMKLQAETNKITDEIDKKAAEDALERINDLVFQTVLATQVTIVDEIKSKSEDGKLTKEEGIEIANSVKEKVLKQISQDILNATKEQISDIEEYVSSRIELELVKVKKELK